MGNFLKDCTGVILAGGENKRMPVPKAFIEVEGQRIIERNLGIMKQLFKEVFIITNQPESYIYLGVPLFGDIYNIRGPMTGIFTALVNSKNSWIFISACDMPFLNGHLIEYLYSKRDDFSAVVPMAGDRVEPLFAFYSKSLLLLMEESILMGRPVIKDFLKNKKVKYVTVDEIKKIDPEMRSFINLNTPEDVEKYLKSRR